MAHRGRENANERLAAELALERPSGTQRQLPGFLSEPLTDDGPISNFARKFLFFRPGWYPLPRDGWRIISPKPPMFSEISSTIQNHLCNSVLP